MIVHNVIPILRIFDYQKAVEFYVEWLGLKIDWEHIFEENTPVYIQLSGNGMTLHLTEHHGDTTPGTRIYIECEGLKEYHEVLINKKYKYNRPGIEKSFHGTWCLEVHDPFGNRLTFNEEVKEKTAT